MLDVLLQDREHTHWRPVTRAAGRHGRRADRNTIAEKNSPLRRKVHDEQHGPTRSDLRSPDILAGPEFGDRVHDRTGLQVHLLSTRRMDASNTAMSPRRTSPFIRITDRRRAGIPVGRALAVVRDLGPSFTGAGLAERIGLERRLAGRFLKRHIIGPRLLTHLELQLSGACEGSPSPQLLSL